MGRKLASGEVLYRQYRRDLEQLVGRNHHFDTCRGRFASREHLRKRDMRHGHAPGDRDRKKKKGSRYIASGGRGKFYGDN